ncbi:MAG: cupin-like domain-containing protein [Cohaesibacteraceae bacterium]
MIFKQFTDEDRALWGKHTVKLNHTLNEHPLFSNEALMSLIDSYPREHYNLTTMAEPGAPKSFWREGEKGAASGADVFDAVANGRIWINMRKVMDVDQRYADVLNEMFEEMAVHVPGFETFKRNMGILVSSPGAQVYYHCDIPGQALWQVRGEKRVYLYPNTDPFLKQAEMEKVILGETEEEVSYDPWFDRHAEVIDLKPGEMLHWPLNAPHRVENLGMLNVSITTEHYTPEIRKQYAVHYANGVLRSRLGMRNLSPHIDGPMVHAKMALAAAVKSGGLQRSRTFQRMVDFRVAKNAPGGYEDVPAYTL